MKLKQIYICEKCGHQESRWTGKCPSCNAWNSFIEDIINIGKREHKSIKTKTPLSLEQISTSENRIKTCIEEVDRVLGGGIVKGSLILLSGEPGIGKSTLTMQLCGKFSQKGHQVLYISGEESEHQIATRAHRLKIDSKNIKLLSCTNLEEILATIEQEKPHFIILDSIQVTASQEIGSLSGSISQIRYSAEKFAEIAKSKNIPIILVGHVTKDGNLAGPRLLEHLVDTVLYIEGERYQNFRLLRSIKNRFGSTNELGIFEMTSHGLTEVENPSKILLQNRKQNAIGSAITSTIEGSRPFLLEVQALTNKTSFGYPKRASQGFDLKRAQILLAVLQKYAKMDFLEQDVYINVVGGFKLKDPACDLAVLIAIASSHLKKPLPNDLLIIGEVGLSGELRPIPLLQKRLKEAEKLGITKALIPHMSEKLSTSIKLIEVSDIKEALSTF